MNPESAILEAKIEDKETEKKELLDTLYEVMIDTCNYTGCEQYPIFDSLCMPSYADALRLLAKQSRVEILTDEGRRVIAKDIIS